MTSISPPLLFSLLLCGSLAPLQSAAAGLENPVGTGAGLSVEDRLKLHEAEQFIQTDEYDKALTLLAEVQKHTPESPEAMVLMGVALSLSHRDLEAEPQFDQAEKAGAWKSEAASMAMVKIKLKRWEWCDAHRERMLEQVASSDPGMLVAFIQWSMRRRDRSILDAALEKVQPRDLAPEIAALVEGAKKFFAQVDEGMGGVAKPDGEGFISIFDGTLKNWDGDPTYWRAENGILTGEVKPETLLKQNSFVVWRGGEVGDFELKGEYRVSAEGNSGINYRSIDVPDVKWAMQGYQDDIDGKDAWSGQNYEERGRQFLAYRGQSVVVHPDGKPELVKELGDRAELQKLIRKEEWNQVSILARGNRMTHVTNGQTMAEVLDEDPKGRRMTGLIGVQVHVGPPMKIEFRNLRLKTLSPVDPSAYKTLKLASGLQLDVPSDWFGLVGKAPKPVSAMEGDDLKPFPKPGPDGQTGWLYVAHPVEGGKISVFVQAEATNGMTEDFIAQLTPAKLAEWGKELQKHVDVSLEPGKSYALSEFKVTPVDRMWGIGFRMESPPASGGQQDPSLNLQFVQGSKRITVALSAPAGELVRWRPVFDQICRSIRIPDGPTE